MSKSTDHDFNEIVYDSVLPEIARAFCSLKKEVSGNKLVNELSPFFKKMKKKGVSSMTDAERKELQDQLAEMIYSLLFENKSDE